MDKETPIQGLAVPVGYPMEGYEISLLDEDGEEVEANQIGEIVVKSSYLPSGFWNRPDLTEASFLPVPGRGEERMYRTGDLGRRLSDGCLIHMGRKDHQVKVRGHRIEVAEIEAALRNLDAVKETVVMPWKGPEGEQHLVAYFVPEAERTPSITALRRELDQKLPGYMVPAYFVQLAEFPRAAGGKINRGALPSPARLRPALQTPFVAPRNPAEAKLARLWAEVLGLDEVGVHDPFLELGGDSLRAMQLVSRILDVFHVELSVRALLDSPTIADMAEVLALHQAGGAGVKQTQMTYDDRLAALVPPPRIHRHRYFAALARTAAYGIFPLQAQTTGVGRSATAGSAVGTARGRLDQIPGGERSTCGRD